MPHTCSKCARANPDEAIYCYHDGVALNNCGGSGTVPVSIGQQPFHSPFVLAAGKTYRNFDQLALGLQEEWPAALEALHQGRLARFLAGEGRADLAVAARRAVAHPDKDRGLAHFLEALPSQALQPPKLVVVPTELNLGKLTVGEERTLSIELENQGMRLIHGSASLDANGSWLSLNSRSRQLRKLISFRDRMTVRLVIQAKSLRASNKPLEARLVIATNAGDVTVRVTAEVPVKAYPSGCLVGARSPRQIAEKARARPQEAAIEFAVGRVAQWYRDNGWPYPVKAPAASGLGAVQQYFVALGLASPRQIEGQRTATPFPIKSDPARGNDSRKSRRRPALWPAVLLLLSLCAVAGWDVFGIQAETDWRKRFKEENDIPQRPFVQPLTALDQEPRIGVSFSRETSRFGIFIQRLRDPKYPEKHKLLTRYDNGLSNNTCVRIDGFDYVFGREVPNARYFRDQKGVLWKEKDIDNNRRKYLTIMEWRNERIRVTQHVEIMIGETTRLYDTCLIKYTVENLDNKAHTIGLRVMLDTFIGANDGVPFEIGPSPDAPVHPMVDTLAVFEKGKVPEFIRALEDPSDVGGSHTTVAEMGLRLRDYEPIQKLVLCRWPQGHGASEARWDWPFESMNNRPNDPDSCVLLYWTKVEMTPGEKRKCGFTYGLGRIAGEPTTDAPEGRVQYGNKLRLFARSSKVNKPFVVSAYLNGVDGQTVKLQLPPELQLLSPSAEQRVKQEAGKPMAHVSWTVKGSKAGLYKVTALLSDGTTAAEHVRILSDSIFD
jgi:hypothetical protein